MKSVNYIHYALILLLGIGFRILFIDSYDMWSDELVAVLSANGQYPLNNADTSVISTQALEALNTVPQVVKSTNYYDSGNAILYTLSLHGWQAVFGNLELAARLFSVLCSVLSCFVVYRLTHFLFKSPTAALLSALLFAIHPLSVEYAQQARTYSLATLLALCSTYYFFEGLKLQKSSSYFLYGFFSILMLLAHYLTLSVLAAHALIFVLASPPKKLWWYQVLSSVVVCILFFTWLKTGGAEGLQMMAQRNAAFTALAQSASVHQNTFFLPATFGNIAAGCLQVVLQVFGNLFQDLNFKLRTLAPLLVIPSFIIVLALRYMRREQSSYRAIFLQILLFVPVQLLFSSVLALQAKHCISFQPLYANFIVPYVCIGLGFSITLLLKQSTVFSLPLLACLLVPLLFIMSLLPVYTGQNGRLPKHQALKVAAQKINDKDTIVVSALSRAQLLYLYLPKHQTNYFKSDTTLKPDSHYILHHSRN